MKPSGRCLLDWRGAPASTSLHALAWGGKRPLQRQPAKCHLLALSRADRGLLGSTRTWPPALFPIGAHGGGATRGSSVEAQNPSTKPPSTHSGQRRFRGLEGRLPTGQEGKEHWSVHE